MADYRTITADATLSDVIISADATLATNITTSSYPDYEGSYTVTPDLTTQTLETAYKIMTDDVVINPIPSNYGLITWNGTVLTVS